MQIPESKDTTLAAYRLRAKRQQQHRQRASKPKVRMAPLDIGMTNVPITKAEQRRRKALAKRAIKKLGR